MATKTSKNTHLSFSELYTFGDSLTSYGDFAAYIQKTVLAAAAQPAWSGVSFSNANFGSQLGLRDLLGISTASVTPPGVLNIPSPYYTLANSYVAIPGLGTPDGPSYAIGGATSGSGSLYDSLEVPVPGGGQVPLSSLFPSLAATGLQNQILAALHQGVRPASDALTLLQGGANDLLIAYLHQVPDLAGVLDQVMANLREDLNVQLRAGGSRQLLSFALADFRGVVDGVAYQMPFLSDILQQASQEDAPAWIKNWGNFVASGGLEQFQVDYKKMLKDLNRQFPYASITYFNPEFGANWQTYGSELGNFASFGINDSISYAQAMNQPLSQAETNRFLYFDIIHTTESGQAMTAKAMNLALEANRSAIEAATLVVQKTGSQRNDCLVASRMNSQLSGLAGDDSLIGQKGNDALRGGTGCDQLLGDQGKDWLQGGEGSDCLTGGKDADFFAWEASDADGDWVDTITDFQGDRLGITAVLDGANPFANPGWTYIGQNGFTGATAELRFSNGWLQGDVDGDARADLNIRLLGVKSFETDWIS